MLIHLSSEMLHSSCQNLLFQERKELLANKVSNLQKLEEASAETEVEEAVASGVEAVELQEVVVNLEEVAVEVEEEAPQEEEGEAIDSNENPLLSNQNLNPR
jgi:hypothetical protein